MIALNERNNNPAFVEISEGTDPTNPLDYPGEPTPTDTTDTTETTESSLSILLFVITSFILGLYLRRRIMQ